MTKKKKKASAAENLIDSLMDDLKDIQLESSISTDEPSFTKQMNNGEVGMPILDDAHVVEVSELNLDAWNDKVDVSKFEFEKIEKDVALPLDTTRPQAKPSEEKTLAVSLEADLKNQLAVPSPEIKSDADKTLAVTGFANAKAALGRPPQADVKVSVGKFGSHKGAANVMTSIDASLAQSENLKLAQQRITELERELDSLRAENEELASAGEIVRSRVDSLNSRIGILEKEKIEAQESAQSEILLLKGGIQFKENEAGKARIKIEELETRLKSDFKKIRVRERELENRLELLRAEKSALVRAKDEYILDQKRKIDQLSQELDNYRKKCLELNKVIEANQDQVKRTERALRLALTNLESKEEGPVPLKKAD